jgi:hypothetical protein
LLLNINLDSYHRAYGVVNDEAGFRRKPQGNRHRLEAAVCASLAPLSQQLAVPTLTFGN